MSRAVFSPLTLEQVRQKMSQFASERDWEQYHTPRNLLLALTGEVGELAEIFQWRGEVQPGLPDFNADDRAHVGQELSDCLLYLIRLADVCGIDLSAAVLDKLQSNAAKYPVNKCKGSADKYTSYVSNDGNTQPEPERSPQNASDTSNNAQ